MKNLLLCLTILVSMPSIASANSVTYTNDDGCVVEKNQRRNGVVLYVSKGDEQEIIGYGNDYSFGDIAYCSDEEAQVNLFEGSLGTGLMISCSEHVNDEYRTRGRAEVSIVNGEITEVSIDGQVKGFFGWKQKANIECLNLVRN